MRAETFPSAARLVAELAAESGDEDFAVVIADVDDIDKDTLESITSMLATRAGRGWIAATKSSAPPSAPIKQLLPLFTRTVTVPALRHRIDDLEDTRAGVPGDLRSRDIGEQPGGGAHRQFLYRATHNLCAGPEPGRHPRGPCGTSPRRIGNVATSSGAKDTRRHAIGGCRRR